MYGSKIITIVSLIGTVITLIVFGFGQDIVIPFYIRILICLLIPVLFLLYIIYYRFKFYKNLELMNKISLIDEIKASKKEIMNIVDSLKSEIINSKTEIDKLITKSKSELIDSNTAINDTISHSKVEIIQQISGTIALHNPKDPLEENLTYQDIEFAIYCLVDQIIKANDITKKEPFLKEIKGKKNVYDTQKNLIICIDRGGAIIGGLLGKSLVLPVASIGIRYAANSPLSQEKGKKGIDTAVDAEKNLTNIDFQKVERILLVDDVIRSGATMNAAKNLLEKYSHSNNSTIQIKIACILKEVLYTHPHQNDDHVIPDFFVYHTKKHEIHTPWDLTHLWDESESKVRKSIPRFEKLCTNVAKRDYLEK